MTFLTYVPDFIGMALLYILIFRKRWAEERPYAHFAFYLIGCFVFAITLSPFIWNIPHLFGGVYTKYNFNPFVDLLNGYGSPLHECIENIILFIPLTYFLRNAYHTSFWKAFLIGVLCSIVIEMTQPLISNIRVCDITDMITNSCGAIIGCCFYSIRLKLFH